MTADGFYTSDVGMRDVYMGNRRRRRSSCRQRPSITSSAAAR